MEVATSTAAHEPTDRHSFTHTSYAPARRGDAADSHGAPPTLCGSCAGAAFGILLLFGSSVFLWMNEGDAVRTQQSLSEARLSLANGGGLIHLTGDLNAGNGGALHDGSFGVSSHAMSLERVVEVFQWRETEHKSSRRVPDGKGGELTETTVTYDYAADWEAREVSSTSFKHPSGHRNPRFHEALGQAAQIAKVDDFGARSWRADAVVLDGLTLAPALRAKAEVTHDLDLEVERVERRLQGLGSAGLVSGRQYVYAEADCAASPRVGCARARWTHAPLQRVSVLAMRRGGSLVEWPNAAGAGYDVGLLEFGERSAVEMLSNASAAASMWLWIKRAVGVLLVWTGWGLLFGPARYLTSWLPVLGGLVGCVLGAIAFGVALCHSLAVIAIAWLFQRPLIATAVLVVCATSLGFGWHSLRSWGSSKRASSSTPMSSTGRAKQM